MSQDVCKLAITDWRHLKAKVLKRDENKCIICGSKNDLILHHVEPLIDDNIIPTSSYERKERLIFRLLRDISRRSGSRRKLTIDALKSIPLTEGEYENIKNGWKQKNSIQNLVILCSECHKEVHSLCLYESYLQGSGLDELPPELLLLHYNWLPDPNNMILREKQKYQKKVEMREKMLKHLIS